MLSHISNLVFLVTSLILLTCANAQFVTTNGLQFELNGKPYSFAGANSWTSKASSHDYEALLTLLTVGATDQGFIHDAIKAAQDIGYKVIRSVFKTPVPIPLDALAGLELGS